MTTQNKIYVVTSKNIGYGYTERVVVIAENLDGMYKYIHEAMRDNLERNPTFPIKHPFESGTYNEKYGAIETGFKVDKVFVIGYALPEQKPGIICIDTFEA